MKRKTTETGSKLLLVGLLVFASLPVSAQGVAWEDLNRAERELLADQESGWAELAPERQERIAIGARRYIEMNRRERTAAQDRFDSWQQLTDRQRTEIRQRYQTFRDLNTTQRDQLRRVYQNFNRLNVDQRNALREQFRNLSQDQRERALQEQRQRALRDRVQDLRRVAPGNQR
jgi:hypothetical protein